MQTVLTGKKSRHMFLRECWELQTGKTGIRFRLSDLSFAISNNALEKKNIGWKQQKKTAVFSLNHQHGCIHRGTDTYVCIYMYVNMKHVAKAGRDWHRWSWCCHLVFFSQPDGLSDDMWELQDRGKFTPKKHVLLGKCRWECSYGVGRVSRFERFDV